MNAEKQVLADIALIRDPSEDPGDAEVAAMDRILDAAELWAKRERQCNGWIGSRCRFEARYDYGSANDFEVKGNLPVTTMATIIEAGRPRKYVHDICVRCGRIVNRS